MHLTNPTLRALRAPRPRLPRPRVRLALELARFLTRDLRCGWTGHAPDSTGTAIVCTRCWSTWTTDHWTRRARRSR